MNKIKKQKTWNPTDDQIKVIKEKYADYYECKVTLTKTRICMMFGISIPLFERWCAKNNMKPKKRDKRENKNFDGYIRVPVPCSYGSITYLLVAPDRCPVKAKENYMKRFPFKSVGV